MTAPRARDRRGVTKAYGDVEVLRGIDLAVREHEAVALIGASGSGKSTLLRCVDLLEEIDDGDVLLDGEVITDPSVNPVEVRRRLGIVFQAFNLFPHLTVLENVDARAACGRTAGRAAAEERARELLARFGLAGREDDYPDRLSGGQQQRVAIVRALATEPRALLLDEVTSALDPELVGEVLGVIRDLKAEGMTMLIATHEMGFAREVADEVCFLHEGRDRRARRGRSGSSAPRAARDAALPATDAGGSIGARSEVRPAAQLSSRCRAKRSSMNASAAAPQRMSGASVGSCAASPPARSTAATLSCTASATTCSS